MSPVYVWGHIALRRMWCECPVWLFGLLKGLPSMQPAFTPAAQILWDAIPQHFQERILHNVWCPHCGDMTTMTDFTGEVHGKSLVLRGTCVTCRGKVTRVLEGAPVREDLQPGDRVIWWKRVPGGDYVYPVRASMTNTSPYTHHRRFGVS